MKHAALAATPGNLYLVPVSGINGLKTMLETRTNNNHDLYDNFAEFLGDNHQSNANFVQAASPAVVLALIERLERAEAALADKQGGV